MERDPEKDTQGDSHTALLQNYVRTCYMSEKLGVTLLQKKFFQANLVGTFSNHYRLLLQKRNPSLFSSLMVLQKFLK